MTTDTMNVRMFCFGFDTDISSHFLSLEILECFQRHSNIVRPKLCNSMCLQ